MRSLTKWFTRNRKTLFITILIYFGILIIYFFVMGLKLSVIYDVGFPEDDYNLFKGINDYQFDWLRSNFDFVTDPFYDWFVQNNLISLILLFTIIFVVIVVIFINRKIIMGEKKVEN